MRLHTDLVNTLRVLNKGSEKLPLTKYMLLLFKSILKFRLKENLSEICDIYKSLTTNVRQKDYLSTVTLSRLRISTK